MKKNITRLIIVLLMFIPTVIAVVSYFQSQNAPVDMKTAQSLTLGDLNGKSYTFKKDVDADKTWMQFFIELRQGATEIAALPESVADQNPFKVTVTTAIKDESYQLFMSTTPTLCYMKDSRGTVYQLAAEDAEAFLESKYAESLYPGAVRPTFTLSNEFTVIPMESKWSYKTHSSKFVSVDTSSVVTSTVQNFKVNGSLAVSFDIVPDLCNVKVIDNTGFVLFEDVAENLPNFKVDSAVDVTVEVTVKWYEESARDYYGENKYAFTASLTAPAAFHTFETDMDVGEFIAISAKNVDDVSKITYKCTPDTGYTPTFFTEGDYAYAFFHVPYDAEAGTYVISLSYGSTVQEISVNVNAKNYGSSDFTVDAATVSGAYSAEALAEYDALVKSLTSKVTDKRLFEGEFVTYPYGYPYSIGAGCGRNITFNGDDATSHINYGILHKPNYNDSPVPALNGGVVVYAGNTAYAGNMVVVDHGFGLMTWYRNMGEISVEVGQTVAKNDKLGVTGETGMAVYHGVNISMSIGEHFVCYYDTSSLETEGEGGIYMQGIYEPAQSN